MREKLSPMMAHYMSVKDEYPDAILLYRLGDFYEMFFDDAVEASRLLDLTLTGRDCGISERAPMCGVPYHAVEGYIAKLVKLGKKVAICEQLTTPADQKGMVKRDVVRVITPGTVNEESMLEGASNNYLASVFVRKNAAAIAYADISTGEIRVSPIGDDIEGYLLTTAPSEIIANSEGYRIISDYESVVQGRLPKPQAYFEYSFDSDSAAKILTRLYGVNNIAALGLEQGSHAVSALGGLLQYVESTQKRLLSNLLTPKTIRSGEYMYIDYRAKRNLELLETLSDKAKHGSLLGVIDRTKTNMGARCIKKWILEPLQNPKDINRRLDAVEELIKQPAVLDKLGDILGNIRDIERVSNKIAYNTINPRECNGVQVSLEEIPNIKQFLSKLKSEYMVSLHSRLDALPQVAKLLQLSLNDNPPLTLKDGGVIRSGYNSELDTYRSAQSSAKKWMAEYEAKERELTGIKNLKVGFNRVFGYYIEVSKSNQSLVPYRYERKQTLTSGERFFTEELKKMETLILNAEENAQKLEERLYAEIKEALLSVIKVIQANAQALAELDVLYSFASIALTNRYSRPKVSSNITHIVIKEGRHPVVETINRTVDFVANDTQIDDFGRMLIVTGPNMAGKSTYMRQTALIVLMAHIGCFVPAKSAEISVVDRIFTRVGASDNLAFGQSTFMVEMTEMADILNNATEKSLLILDEIGRGTSTLDGLAIAWAIVEYISFKIKAKTLFATHYHELSELETLIPDVKNYRILIKESKDGITFLYKIARGGASKSFGIEVAALAGVNSRVTERARDIIAALEQTHNLTGELNKRLTANPSEDAVPIDQIGFFEENTSLNEIQKTLVDIDIDSCTPMQALTILSDLKKKAVVSSPKRKGK
ncbi:MAG: DNA mismatch repair protein MutS [Clostridia bacterium]